MFCKTLGCEFTAIQHTDCPADGYDAVQVWRCGNSVTLGHFDTEEAAEAAATAERERQLRNSDRTGDVATDRLKGEICTTQHGHEIVWDGHLCEGANLTPPRDDNFCLWTRCGAADVPAGMGHEGDIRDVTCPDCLKVWNAENGQFGVGA